MKTMNRLNKLVMIAVVLLSANLSISCNSDDDAPSEPSIVGTWVDVSFEDVKFVNGESQGINDSGDIDQQDATTFTFNSDGTFTESYIELSETITASGTYTTNDNILNVTYEDGEINQSTFTVTRSVLTTVYTEEDTADNGDEIKYVITTSWERQ